MAAPNDAASLREKLAEAKLALGLVVLLIAAVVAVLIITEPLASDPAGGAGTSVGRIYWSNYAAKKLSYADLDGAGGGDLPNTYDNFNFAQGLAIDSTTGRVYWAARIRDKISYANLDGSGSFADLNTTGASAVNSP